MEEKELKKRILRTDLDGVVFRWLCLVIVCVLRSLSVGQLYYELMISEKIQKYYLLVNTHTGLLLVNQHTDILGNRSKIIFSKSSSWC